MTKNPNRPEKKSIEEWAADVTFRDEQFSIYHHGRDVEAHFPKRQCIDNPERAIDAMLALYIHPQWPNLDRKIARESALRIIYATAITDALHEVVESIKFQGERPLKPHPREEDPVWDLLQDIAQAAATRLLKEHPRND